MLALAGCDAVPGRPRPGARELAPTEVMAFETLYARDCAGCHGRTGRLGAARALNDPVYLAVAPPERVRRVIATGVPGTAQPPFALSAGGSLTDRQIDVLVRGIRDRWQRPGAATGHQIPPYDGGRAAGGDVDRGIYLRASAPAHRWAVLDRARSDRRLPRGPDSTGNVRESGPRPVGRRDREDRLLGASHRG